MHPQKVNNLLPVFCLLALTACSLAAPSAPGATGVTPGVAAGITPTAAVTATAAAAPDVPAGDLSKAVIGPQGGRLQSSEGGLALDVPAGALPSDTTIGIQPVQATDDGDLGFAYRLTPEKQTFAKPVTFTFHLNADQLDGSALGAVGAAYQLDDGTWQDVPVSAVDDKAGTVSIQTDHFTKYKVYTAYRISPARKSVLAGSRVDFSLIATRHGKAAAAGAAGAGAQTWSVQGITGGNPAVGTVGPAGPGGEYLAPARAPKPDTVTVSVQVETPSGPQVLAAAVRILDPEWTLIVDQVYNQVCVDPGASDSGGVLPISFRSERIQYVQVTLDRDLKATAAVKSKDAAIKMPEFASCSNMLNLASASFPPNSLSIQTVQASYDEKLGKFSFELTGTWINFPALIGKAMGENFSAPPGKPIAWIVPEVSMLAEDGTVNTDQVSTTPAGDTEGPTFTLQAGGGQ